ncbi:hypothetical protein [Bartonella rattaustraliani]|nr:hypothetical protein [Bartonella rattaustraliani]
MTFIDAPFGRLSPQGYLQDRTEYPLPVPRTWSRLLEERERKKRE